MNQVKHSSSGHRIDCWELGKTEIWENPRRARCLKKTEIKQKLKWSFTVLSPEDSFGALWHFLGPILPYKVSDFYFWMLLFNYKEIRKMHYYKKKYYFSSIWPFFNLINNLLFFSVWLIKLLVESDTPFKINEG